ncbi:MAG: Pyruvate-flavodoxin oxidoreductase [Chloroflexi bacterium ADurb.Bin325]|nr:MAG: Pyruvate-flavodoxin oxidoreductase [Chloroflexi bacterium ADurb.Bin325]
MPERRIVTIDGNEAAAHIAHKTNEVIAIYPITPSSNMGEWADAWSAQGRKNIWGTVPLVVEMQSEGGAAGAVHGALQTGSLTTTFTASQGLLLMIPNMFKIAGELTSTVFHVSARTVATHALSIYGDHSDVMACRSTGWGMLCSNSVQEVMDLALIAQAATLEARVPFIHFFDGFRTSHELNKIEELADEDIRAMIDDNLVMAHRARGLTPEKPVVRGTAQNPDVFFQTREASNPYYLATPGIVQAQMDKFAQLVGRQYHLFDYYGAPDAERVIVVMGSAAEVAQATVDHLLAQGEKVGVLKVRLYRPFSVQHFIDALPSTVKIVATLDRTKEPGAAGEPLYQDVATAVVETGAAFRVIGGRYGLAGKEFTPAMCKAVFDNMAQAKPKNHFTVGIVDDVTHTSLDVDPSFNIEPANMVRALFYGLGADGTVGANHNSIRIIGTETPNSAQGFFVYDSKKSGSTTTSHLRFGPEAIHAPYLIQSANFIAIHQWVFVERYNVLPIAEKNAVFLLNSPYGPDEVWDQLPRSMQQQIIDKDLRFFVIDAYKVARDTGMGVRINTIMQTAFFAISGVLPRDEAIDKIKESIRKTYGRRGEAVVQQNFAAVDHTLSHLYEVHYPRQVTSQIERPPTVDASAPEFVQDVTAPIMAGLGELLPASMLPADGTWPSATTQWEKRNIALEIPVWDESICIQCGKCAFVCPHAAIRTKVYPAEALTDAPATFKAMDYKGRELPGMKYTVQVAPEDCTGCALCVEACPAKNKSEPRFKALNMAPQPPLRFAERDNFAYFIALPELDRTLIQPNNVKNSQMLQPLFEFSGACSGCGETPYVKLVSQLFGDRAIIANATGCSSIYGANLPTTPWSVNKEGRGPAWSNSLFEDNAEFGLGFRLTLDKQSEFAAELVQGHRDVLGDELADALLNAEQATERGIMEQRARVAAVKERLANVGEPWARQLTTVVDSLIKRSVWIIGGDGWAYDIGYGGLDHVLASGRKVNVLVLDTQVYSNTGGQSSKATPRAAVARFAAAGKPLPKKDLGAIAMSYGSIYVAQVAMGASDAQTVRAFLEAEAYPGPSLIIAYSHCIAHGINMTKGLDQQKLAVDSGAWPLYRFNPLLAEQGRNPLTLDSKAPKIPLRDYIYNETRYSALVRSDEERAEMLLGLAQADVEKRWRQYEQLATIPSTPEK